MSLPNANISPNAYDNALLATDDFIAQSIQWLQTHSNAYDVSMLYVSDHGEFESG